MKISSDQELLETIAQTNLSIQAIHDYLGNDDLEEYDNKTNKIRFPRGYLRTVNYFSKVLSFIPDKTLRTNLSYSLIFSDIHRWLLNRTDIAGTAREMIIKNGIILLSSLTESICRFTTINKISKKKGFDERAKLMCEKKVFDEDLRDDLIKLWEMRKSIHIYLLTEQEYNKYRDDDYNFALSVINRLVESLKKFN